MSMIKGPVFGRRSKRLVANNKAPSSLQGVHVNQQDWYRGWSARTTNGWINRFHKAQAGERALRQIRRNLHFVVPRVNSGIPALERAGGPWLNPTFRYKGPGQWFSPESSFATGRYGLPAKAAYNKSHYQRAMIAKFQR